MEQHYQELEVKLDASPDEITQSYRRLIALYHPDRYPGPASEEMSKRLNFAYNKIQEYLESNNTDNTFRTEEHNENVNETVNEDITRDPYTQAGEFVGNILLGIVFLIGGAFAIIALGILYKIFMFLFRLVFL